jgi:long-chain acyl-CoA synthetase
MANTTPWLNQYEAGVPSTIAVPDDTLPELLVKSARQYGKNSAVHMVLKYLPLGLAIHSKLSYSQLNDATDRLAAALQNTGVRPHDRVAIMLPNIPQYVIAYFGAIKAGAIVVNVNPTYTSRELRNQLMDSGAETIVLLSGHYPKLAEIQDDTAIKHVIVTDVPDTLGWPFNKLVAKQVRRSGMMIDIPAQPNLYYFNKLIKEAPATPPTYRAAPDDVLLLQYTGGTTGVPKGAMLTHRNLVNMAHQMEVWFTDAVPGQEKVLGALPFFHIYGMSVGMLFAIKLGAELVVTPDPRNTDLVMEIIQRERVTLYPGVPNLYNIIINHPKVQQYDLRSVKACLSGGASLPVEVARRFRELTGGRLVEGYGLSESSPVATANPLYGEHRTGSVGLPIPNTVVKVVSLEVDAEGNSPELPPGEEGELVIYGPQVMKGYWNTPEETSLVFTPDGGLRTGDIGKMDADGYFYIVDRKKDIIITSGYNLVPREVEEVLYMHPKILEAAVAGVPHEARGEIVKAFVVLKPGEEATAAELRSFCRKHLAPYKVPRQVEFRDSLPKSQIGKVLRRLLVEEDGQKTGSPTSTVSKVTTPEERKEAQ